MKLKYFLGLFLSAILFVGCSDENDLGLFNEIINMNINENYNQEEIEDYIKVINSYPIKRKEKELKEKLKEEKDPIKQASILSEILSLKGVKR